MKKGLLWLNSAKFPEPSPEPTVNEVQWLQFQLDEYATVREVIDNLDRIKVTKRFATVHYFICDASGACAVVDPVDGKLVSHFGRDVTSRALTNSPYDDSKKFAEKYLTSRNLSDLPQATKSLDRFARLAYLQPLRKKASVESVFLDLDKVRSSTSDSDDSPTQWSVVNDLSLFPNDGRARVEENRVGKDRLFLFFAGKGSGYKFEQSWGRHQRLCCLRREK